jgi:hypothetical protein
VSNFKGLGVNIELYGAPSCNIILPPSIHPFSTPGNLVRYTWWSSGKLLVITYLSLVGMFGFKTNSATPTQIGHTKDWSWLKNYRIDFRNLDFIKCWQLLGSYGRRIDDPDTKRVRHTVQCPWIDKHTDTGRQWTPENSSTVIFIEEGQFPEFHCSHTTYCADCGLKEVVEWMESVRPGILEECCPRDYQPPPRISSAHSPAPDPPDIQTGNEPPPCPYDPVDWEALRAKVAINPAGRFVQEAIYA